MEKFNSKVVQIEAAQWDGTVEGATEVINWALDNGGTIRFRDKGEDDYDLHQPFLHVDTLEGTMRAQKSDWIIKGTEGEFYPCKDSVFQRKYEVAR